MGGPACSDHLLLRGEDADVTRCLESKRRGPGVAGVGWAVGERPWAWAQRDPGGQQRRKPQLPAGRMSAGRGASPRGGAVVHPRRLPLGLLGCPFSRVPPPYSGQSGGKPFHLRPCRPLSPGKRPCAARSPPGSIEAPGPPLLSVLQQARRRRLELSPLGRAGGAWAGGRCRTAFGAAPWPPAALLSEPHCPGRWWLGRAPGDASRALGGRWGGVAGCTYGTPQDRGRPSGDGDLLHF